MVGLVKTYTRRRRDDMYFDRFDICEAWYLALSEEHSGQWSEAYARLSRLTGYFNPSPVLSVDSLTENGRVIYDNAIAALTSQSQQ